MEKTPPAGFEKIPHEPGCYLYKNAQNSTIYIGKAKDLKKRVSSYFTKTSPDQKTAQLVNNIASVEFIATNSEYEAFILENNLIKEHKPKYNIDLKDSRRYAYIQITREAFPRILLARERKEAGEYFGPFTSGKTRDHLIYLVNRIFRFRTCKKLPKKACLRLQLGLCDAPCINAISKEEYDERINHAKQILRGDTAGVITQLETEMNQAAREQLFEKAKNLRDMIFSLKHLQETQEQHQAVERKWDKVEDVLNYLVHETQVKLMLFHVRHGMLLDRQEFEFPQFYNWLPDFLSQYYSENAIPAEVILPENLAQEDQESLQEFLSIKKGSPVAITVPQRGEKKELLDLAMKNLELALFKNARKLEALKLALDLPKIPHVIECFDISHLSGTLGVGSMVQFRDGVPDKTNYRRFKIKSFVGNDDFRSIAEIVQRRYFRLSQEGKEFPDLIVIDGGIGQLNAAASELKKLSLDLPIISLAKQFEEVYLLDAPYPLQLDRKSDALKYLQQIRDEAHRFAIKYNRLLRSKKFKKEAADYAKAT